MKSKKLLKNKKDPDKKETVSKSGISLFIIFCCSALIFIFSAADLLTPTLMKQTEERYRQKITLDDIFSADLLVEGDRFTSAGSDPRITLPTSEETVNKLVINFSRPLESSQNAKIYYAVNGNALSEEFTETGVMEAGSLCFEVDLEDNVYTALRFDASGEYYIDSFYLKYIEAVYNETPDVPAWVMLFCSFAAAASILIFFRKSIPGNIPEIKEVLYNNRKQLIGTAAAALCIIAVTAYIDAGLDSEPQEDLSDLTNITVFLALTPLVTASVYNILRYRDTDKSFLRAALWIVDSLSMSFCVTAFYNKLILGLYSAGSLFTGPSLLRSLVFLILTVPGSAFLFFDRKKVVDLLFTKRWVIAAAVFALMVIFNLNVSNLAHFDRIIQQDVGTEYSAPILGTTRGIRSDEWGVTYPKMISGEYVGYGSENNIVRGTYNTGLSGSELYLSYSALAKPLCFGFYLFGSERGISFFSMGSLIFSFMVWLEVSYIISGKNRLFALFGGCAAGLSQFILWWSLDVVWMYAGAVIVCMYYFVQSEKRSHKILFAAGVAFSGASFITVLYPPWQVPLAYILIGFFVWILIDNRDKVRAFKKFEWIVIASAFVFMASLVLSYLNDLTFYIDRVSQTIYPGSRFETGGSGNYKPFYYIQTLMYPLKNVNDANNSEAGIYFSLFPLPILFGVLCAIKQIAGKIRKKAVSIDLLNLILLGITAYLGVYLYIGVPEWLAKITLIGNSTYRCMDVLSLLTLLLLIRNAGCDAEKNRLSYVTGAAASALTIAASAYLSGKVYPGYMPGYYTALISILTFAFSMAVFCKPEKKLRSVIILLMSAAIAFSGMLVLPVTKGIDALKKKPASAAVREIVERDPDAKWASDYIWASSFLISNGASCITSINYIPNMELWTKLDPERKYEKYYNRYFHVSFALTDDETSFEYIRHDHLRLYLNYADIRKCDLDYLFFTVPLEEDSDEIDLELIYSECNCYIYKIKYLT